MKTILLIVTVLNLCFAHDNAAAKKQTKPILISNGTLHIGNGSVLENTDILFEKGKITKIAKNIVAPNDCEKIDASGKHVYPGLISTLSPLGLIEIEAVRSTRDNDEVGNFNSEVKASTVYNPDSEIIPVVRANGVTTALIIPTGNLIGGQSSIVQLDGWTIEDAGLKLENGMFLSWPAMSVYNLSYLPPIEKQKENIQTNQKKLTDFFVEVQKYIIKKLRILILK